MSDRDTYRKHNHPAFGHYVPGCASCDYDRDYSGHPARDYSDRPDREYLAILEAVANLSPSVARDPDVQRAVRAAADRL